MQDLWWSIWTKSSDHQQVVNRPLFSFQTPGGWTDVSLYLSVTLLLSLRIPQLLRVSGDESGFDHQLLCAFCVGRVGRIDQIQELVPSLAPEPDPVQVLPHGGRRGADLYLNMAAGGAAETGRNAENQNHECLKMLCGARGKVSVRGKVTSVHPLGSMNICTKM